MRTYRGVRSDGVCVVTVVDDTGEHPLDPRLDLWSHSPTGFEWSYLGSGPAQLALALVADALRNHAEAVRVHQEFKRRVVARLPREGWQLTEEEVLQAVRAAAGR